MELLPTEVINEYVMEDEYCDYSSDCECLCKFTLKLFSQYELFSQYATVNPLEVTRQKS